VTSQPSPPSARLQPSARAQTPSGSSAEAWTELQEYLHMREAFLSSQIVQQELARLQEGMHNTQASTMAHATPSSAVPSHIRRRHSLSRSGLDQAVPATVPRNFTMPVPDDVVTPRWASPRDRLHPHGGNTAMLQNFGMSDAMVGTEVASLLIHSPLWSVFSPRMTV
jgi:hypothetical protein